MTDMRRTILWVVFTMSLVLLWDGWNKHNGKPALFGPSTSTSTSAGSTAQPPAVPSGGASSLPDASVPQPGSAAAGAMPPAVAPAASAPAATATVSVQTDVLKATVDARGGDVVHIELIKHIDQADRTRNVVLLDRSPQRLYVAQTGLIGAPNLPTHLSTFKLLPGPTTLADGSDTLSVAFESPEMGGVRLKKTLTFQRGSYEVDVKHEVTNVSGAPIAPQVYLQLVRDGNVEAHSFFMAPTSFTGPAAYSDASKFIKIDFPTIEKGKAELPAAGNNGWVAMVQHYFVSAWLHPEPAPREFFTKRVDTNLYSIGQIFPLGSIEPGATKTFDAQLFVGPQEEKKLEVLTPGLELVKDYGWFTILAKPLFWVLDQLHKLIGNWGWSIVALVVLLKAAFYGLNASAYRSMAKMKAVNPKIMEMRERLKDKPQQLQQEMMRIYKEEKVNPLGGCLPIVVQMPVFIALYWVLLSSVEMRNAPWIGWITDLSVKDPLYILPIVMTGTTLLQTWLNPTPPDPLQARMMWIMPLVFSVMFFIFPAGLVLYWITNNLLSIAQQYVINKRLGVN